MLGCMLVLHTKVNFNANFRGANGQQASAPPAQQQKHQPHKDDDDEDSDDFDA